MKHDGLLMCQAWTQVNKKSSLLFKFCHSFRFYNTFSLSPLHTQRCILLSFGIRCSYLPKYKG